MCASGYGFVKVTEMGNVNGGSVNSAGHVSVSIQNIVLSKARQLVNVAMLRELPL